MTNSIPSLILALISFLIVIIQITASTAPVLDSPNGDQVHHLIELHHNRYKILKKWFASKMLDGAAETDSESSPFHVLRSNQQFKGCIDPSEPFQCPESEQCIALQFVCNGQPNDCPRNTDENEEICIAIKRPAKENIQNYLFAQYTLHGLDLFTFLFGENLSRSIKQNSAFWIDALASAFSVSKNIRTFADKTYMSPKDFSHFKHAIASIHDGRLEEIPMYAQEAVHQGLGSLIEKLYESGFMTQ